MAIQGQSGVTRSQGGLPVGNRGSLDPGVHYAQKLHDDQFSCGNDYSLKVRKPYTITKQRERWTDEEHKKFLEALKLYGRAWRRIEEHVGTKTAVQIRSHAQKFFSKILRDTNGNNTTLVESIEIPPPRPKRKPVHPYPRKLVEIPKNEMSNLDHPLRSNSLKSLDFGQENKSPKSVLSTVVSETLGSSDSDNTPTGSLSPVSSISAVHTSSFPLVEPKSSSSEEDVSPQPDGLNAGSPHAKQQPLVKLELFSKESVSTKDDEAEESPGRTLKLFGTTLLVTACSKPSSPSMEASKPTPAMYDLSTIVPWWSTLSHNTVFMPLHKEDLDEGKNLHSNLVECEDKEVQKEGSCVGSNNTSSMNDVENNERSDDDDQAKSTHVQCYLVGHTTPSETVWPKAKTCGGKGFVPYKRCIAERENQCLDEEREEKRVRLSL